MVRAVLEGRKTQTRRIVKFPPDWDGQVVFPNGSYGVKYSKTDGTVWRLHPKYDRRETLWVEEPFALICSAGEGKCAGEDCLHCRYEYQADNLNAKWAGGWPNTLKGYEVPDGCKWQQSMLMPKRASRILIQITGIKAEPLLAISEVDAIAEGVERWPDGNFKAYGKYPGKYTFARDSFLSLWDKIYGDGAHKANPWVFVYDFVKL